jgi:hypothetical protein
MFPLGTAGAALLVLRVSVAATLIANGAAHWARTPSPLITVGLALLAISLCLGLFTPYCSTAACLIQTYLLVLGSGTDKFQLAVAILNSVVLVLLGPGAYSGDARIFGRKRLTLPSRKKSHL